MTAHPPLSLPRAILFDMDGTLTQPALDFPRIKEEMGIGPVPILEALEKLDPNARQKAEAVLHRWEDEVATHSTLNPGCIELLDWLIQRKIRLALITRNSRQSVQTVVKLHGIKVEVLITREDPPFKPHPEPLQRACRRLEVDPAHAWMVGDGVYDIEAGVAAGIKTVWISHGKPKPFLAEPWKIVDDIQSLSAFIKTLGR